MIECSDSLKFLNKIKDLDNDIIYCDPPYALGSEVIIRKDGKVDYSKANDFMNKWEMPTGEYWEKWFVEAYRTLKHGGYLIMFGMDRQLLLFKYYACLAGFVEQQSLYWYFISNFPKATDLSKMIDRNNGRTLEQYKELGKYIKESRGDKPQKNISKFFPSKTGNLTGCVANWELGLNVPTMEQWKILKRELDLDNRFDELIEREEAEREVISIKKGLKSNDGVFNNENSGLFDKDIEITAPSTDLAKKYEGYKYSISPLKQTNETIMVFQKPCKTGSPLHDTLAYENGDKTISVSALNIDGNRVGTEIIGGGTMPDLRDVGKMSKESIGIYKLSFGQNSRPAERKEYEESTGRYPAQTFIDSQVAGRLDLQSGGLSGGVGRANRSDVGGGVTSFHNIGSITETETKDYGGCSKILHKCDYTDEDYDLYFYEPKVSSSERNAGCDDMSEKTMNNTETQSRTWNDRCLTCGKKFVGSSETICHCPSELKITDKTVFKWKNNHPTLKPIALNEKILKLFKTPNDQKICYAFAGAGSEIIGGIKAGFDNWCGCEINQEYVDIANARIKYWKEEMSTQTTIFDFI